MKRQAQGGLHVIVAIIGVEVRLPPAVERGGELYGAYRTAGVLC